MDRCHLRRWFVFGEHPDGRVDIADTDGDIMTKVEPELAKKICNRRDKWVDDLEQLLG